jgi:hypothetical protein
VVLRAAQAERSLKLTSRPDIDRFGDGRGTDERDRFDVRMIAKGLHGGPLAVNDVKHSRRQPGFGEQFSGPHGGERHFVGGLENERVAEHDRDRDRPVRDHHGKVERGDRSDNTERHPIDAAFHARADLQHLARRKLWQRAGKLGNLDRPHNLRPSLFERLAVLDVNLLGQFINAAEQQLAIAVHDAGPLFERSPGPSWKCLLRGSSRSGDFGRT